MVLILARARMYRILLEIFDRLSILNSRGCCQTMTMFAGPSGFDGIVSSIANRLR